MIHVRRHTVDIPNVCPYCQFAGIQYSCFKNHMKAKHTSQKALNLLDHVFSRKTSLKLVDNLLVGHDDPIKEMRNNVEEIWKEGASKRILRTLSSKPKFGGFSLFADNVGKVN